MILMASKGHFLTQIPQPIHKVSEMNAILDVGPTSIHSLPVLTTGQAFLYGCLIKVLIFVFGYYFAFFKKILVVISLILKKKKFIPLLFIIIIPV